MVIIWSTPALEDLRLIHQYIAHDSEHYANQVIADMLEKVELLATSARIGREVPEIGEADIREIGVHSWRVLYEVHATSVTIHAVIHKRRHFNPSQTE